MNKESWNQIWPNAHNWPEPTKSNTLRCDLPLIANSMQKTNILNNSFQRNCWSKNPAIQFNKKFNWAHPTKNGSLRCYLPLMTNCMHKKLRYQLILSKILIIKESSNLITWKTNLATSDQTTTFPDAAFAWRSTPSKNN